MAHIPDGFLSAPVIAGTAALSAAAIAVAARRSRRELNERQAPVLGALTAFVFAAQMFNFPLGAGTSAHLLGGVLLAVIVGPWAGMLALFAVLLVQALLFQDGGIAALGANTLNLAVIGAGGGYLIYRWQLAVFGDGRRGRLTAAAIAAFLSTLLSGIAVGLQLGFSGMVPVGTAVAAVGGAHILVGAAEATITVGVLAAALRSRPELARDRAPARKTRVAAGFTTAALGVALAAVALASESPDALESAAGRLGFGEGTGWSLSPMADYTSALGGPWAAAVIGLAAAFLIGWVAARLIGRSRSAVA